MLIFYCLIKWKWDLLLHSSFEKSDSSYLSFWVALLNYFLSFSSTIFILLFMTVFDTVLCTHQIKMYTNKFVVYPKFLEAITFIYFDPAFFIGCFFVCLNFLTWMPRHCLIVPVMFLQSWSNLLNPLFLDNFFSLNLQIEIIIGWPAKFQKKVPGISIIFRQKLSFPLNAHQFTLWVAFSKVIGSYLYGLD